MSGSKLPSRGHFLDVAGQHIVVHQAGDDLLEVSPSGMLIWWMTTLPSLDDGRDDVAQAGMRLELIFAGFEALVSLENEHAADEDPGLVDDAILVKHIGDVANAGAARNIDDLVVRQRARQHRNAACR